jgi:hypothetical protein
MSVSTQYLDFLRDHLQASVLSVYLEGAASQRVTTLMQTPSLMVIGGAHDVVSHFVAELPEAIGDRVIVAEDLRMHTPPSDIVVLTREATEELLAERQVRWFAPLREQAYADQHAALGLRAAQRATSLGAVEQLMLTEHDRRAPPIDAETLAVETLWHGGTVTLASSAVADEMDRDAGGVAVHAERGDQQPLAHELLRHRIRISAPPAWRGGAIRRAPRWPDRAPTRGCSTWWWCAR